ncbi:MAG: HAMP domain-containing protein [Opitutaceae bacterium]|nr:HAMP domain-containing protein [Opitutaceae bacterium]
MRSLRFRLTLWFSLAVTLTAGSAAAIGYFVVRKQMHDGIDFLLAAETEEILHRMGPHPERLPHDELISALRGHTEIDAPIYYFQIHRDGEGVIFRSRNLGDLVLPDLGDRVTAVRTVTLRDEPIRVREQYYQTYHVQIATNLEQVEQLIDQYQRLLLVGLPLLFLCSIVVGLLLSEIALKPVRAMQRSAQHISASNLSERLPVPAGKDEIAALARLLNDLFARLEAAFEQVKRFTADASHELKTPLSLIRLHAERLQHSSALTPADLAQVESQLEEITRLNKLVESLLFIAKADAGSLPLDRRRHDLQRFVAEIDEDAAALCEDRGLTFHVTRHDSGTAEFDAVLVRQVLLNVLSNAIRHTPKGRSITLGSGCATDAWTITIDDQGPGVPPEQLEQIFGRFVRGPGADEHAPGGSGLGLAIARSIVEAHGGTITAVNRDGGGLRVTIRLPHTPR